MLLSFKMAAQMQHFSLLSSEPHLSPTCSSSSLSCQLGYRCMKCTKKTEEEESQNQKQYNLCSLK